MKLHCRSLRAIICNFPLLLCLILSPAVLGAEDARFAGPSADWSLYLKVQLEAKWKSSSLKPGDIVEGKLCRNAYWGQKEVLPAGSRVRLIVHTVERRPREPNDHWPWVIRAFTPRHERYPTFRSAQVFLPGGKEVDLKVTFVSIRREVEMHVKPVKGDLNEQEVAEMAKADRAPKPIWAKPARKSKNPVSGPVATLEAAVSGADFSTAATGEPTRSSSVPVDITAGTEARVVLLDGISASRSHTGETFHARLLEPISVDSAVALPAGSIFEGKVTISKRPRMLSRAGSLAVSFSSVTLPDGTSKRLEASLSGVDLDRRSHTKIDAEGQLHGDRPGTAWTLMNLAVTGGIAKVVDDGTQLAMEAIVAAATDASTAGISRIVSTCVSGVFLLTRHGRDVILPKFTEMEITFDRPLVLSTASQAQETSQADQQTQPAGQR
jgi:hypothetical protein